MHIIENMLRSILLIGVCPPVATLSLLLPYPPKAGKAMKQPPTRFAAPNATSSRLALKANPCSPSPDFESPPGKLLAATEDSKNPNKAIKNEVPMASRRWFIVGDLNGQWNVKGDPVLDSTLPRISSPCWSQRNVQEKIADNNTTMKRSGK